MWHRDTGQVKHVSIGSSEPQKNQLMQVWALMIYLFFLVWTAVIQSSLESTGCPLAFHLNGSEIQFETIYTSAMCSSASVKHHGAAIHILQLKLLRLKEQLKKKPLIKPTVLGH